MTESIDPKEFFRSESNQLREVERPPSTIWVGRFAVLAIIIFGFLLGFKNGGADTWRLPGINQSFNINDVWHIIPWVSLSTAIAGLALVWLEGNYVRNRARALKTARIAAGIIFLSVFVTAAKDATDTPFDYWNFVLSWYLIPAGFATAMFLAAEAAFGV